LEPLFRFMTVRPLGRAEAPTLPLETNTDFQTALVEAAASNRPRTETKAIAERFAESSAFVRTAKDVTRGEELIQLHEQLHRGGVAEDPTNAVRAAFNEIPPSDRQSDAKRVRDSILAAYLIPLQDVRAEPLQALARIYAIADVVIDGSSSRSTKRILSDSFSIPAALVALRDPAPGPNEPGPPADVEGAVRRLQALDERRNRLQATLDELDAHEDDELVVREAANDVPLNAFLGARRENVQRENVQRENVQREIRRRIEGPIAASSSTMRRIGEGRNVFLSGESAQRLTESTRSTLRELKMDPSIESLAGVRAGIKHELSGIAGQMHTLSGEITLGKPGDVESAAYTDVTAAQAHLLKHYPPVDDPLPIDKPLTPAAPALPDPSIHGTAKPVGIADLQLVRHHLLRYEHGELAYVESILKGEKLTHTLMTALTAETTTTEETERTDLQGEARSVAESRTSSVQAVSPGYGPVTQSPNAQAFAESVTNQASSNITNRIRSIAVRRLLSERTDTLEHIFDNHDSATAQYGTYHWLERIYEGRVFSYGPRLIYDVVVPEPSALYLSAASLQRAGLPVPVRPAKFDILPQDIDELNWDYLANGHGATGVMPPPPKQVIVTEPFGKQAADPAGSIFSAEERRVTIPKGYQAANYRVNATTVAWNSDSSWVFLNIGTKCMNLISREYVNRYLEGALRKEVETIPVGLIVDTNGADPGASTIAVGVEIICERTDGFMAEWQAKTHDQILAANRRRFQEFEERLVNRDASFRLFLQSLTTEQKRAIVRTEVKRSAISVLTNQDFSGFSATQIDALGLPQPNLAAIDQLSAYIRFFEQAVDWQLAAWSFYPYFWGRKQTWVARLGLNESDPSFSAFLMSGAARVMLPIRPGYEKAFEHFMNTGHIPSTDELLDVGGPLWVSLTTQLQSDEAADGTEVQQGEAWIFSVSSGLTRARPDGSMPLWAFSANKWQESNDPSY
jgi:hypothetical protein